MHHAIRMSVFNGSIDADLTGKADKTAEFLQVELTNGMGIKKVKTRLVGEYNLPNVLAAISVGKYFNIHKIILRLNNSYVNLIIY